MSFSNAPDEDLLGRVAGALAVDEAFVEKDWFVVQAIESLSRLATPMITPVFSGGTSLLKGYRLIRRFSEDIDFKLILSDAFGDLSRSKRKSTLKAFRDSVVDAWSAQGFTITACVPRDEYGFLEFEMDYPSILEPHDSLRPHILAQISAKPPRLPVQHRPLTSFVAQYAGAAAEVLAIACIDPVETAADKMSALSWRMLTRDRDHPEDDPTIVRHLHDLTALEGHVIASPAFPDLLKTVMLADQARGQGRVADLSPGDRLAAMKARLAEDGLYAQEYARFVGGMAFAGEGDIPDFAATVATVARLSRLLAG